MDGAMFPLGWQHYLGGGALIGLGVGLLFALTGLIGGMSTVFSSSWSFVSRRPFFQQGALVASRRWRLVYAAGLVLGAFLCARWAGSAVAVTAVPLWRLALGGVLVGFGARLGKGCTSGHGICGMASLQWPSMLAVITFLATAMATAHLVAAAGGRP
jgi:uncharacterized membrane protein YedE/YeeE